MHFLFSFLSKLVFLVSWNADEPLIKVDQTELTKSKIVPPITILARTRIFVYEFPLICVYKNSDMIRPYNS